MELKTARLTLLIDPYKKAAFERLCAQQDRTPSQVVRQLIRNYLAEHDVSYVGGDARREAGDALRSAGPRGDKARPPPPAAGRPLPAPGQRGAKRKPA